MGKFIVVAGFFLIVVGGLFMLIESLSGSRGGWLPGDIVFRRGNFTFYFPIVTSIVVSIVLSIILYILFGMRR